MYHSHMSRLQVRMSSWRGMSSWGGCKGLLLLDHSSGVEIAQVFWSSLPLCSRGDDVVLAGLSQGVSLLLPPRRCKGGDSGRMDMSMMWGT